MNEGKDVLNGKPGNAITSFGRFVLINIAHIFFIDTYNVDLLNHL